MMEKLRMSPFSIYHQCRDAFAFLQPPLIDCIIKAAKPEMIFLLGASLYSRRSESIFNISVPSSQHIADCFLLVLMRDLSDKEPYEWQDKIENHCKKIVPVTVIVLQYTIFEEWLKAGHQFACTVWQSAALIYESGSVSCTVPTNTGVETTGKDRECFYGEGLAKAREFLAGSELFRVRKQYSLAAFMLHQSAEQALRTLLQTATGYHINTHSIDRLIRCASLVAYRLPDIFPQKTEQDKRLLGLLQRAYTDTRYTTAYSISREDLAALTEKVRHIHEILFDTGEALFGTAALSPEQLQ